MPTEAAQPQGALARLDALTAWALARAAVRSPTVILGVSAIIAIVGFGLAERLQLVELDVRTAFVIGVGLGVAVGAAFASQARAALEGPFGFVVIRPSQMTGLILRRTGLVLTVLMASLIALVVAVQPESWLRGAAAALLGSALGAGAAVVLGRVWAHGTAPFRVNWFGLARLGIWRARLLQVLPSLTLMLLALQARVLGAEVQAQILATAGAVSAVLTVLPVDPARLNLLASTPQSMVRLILPLAVPSLVAGVLGGAAAGLIGGLAPALSLAVALGLGSVGGLARVFLGLAALGRTETAARTAGTVELLVAVILPFAGPLAIGSAALVWIAGRMIWLWRRGERVRWLDPEGER